MPLISLRGPDALRIRKANEVARWGRRSEENRIEPLAKPAFDVPFQLEPGEPIFTIGSCFARHVEGELIERGFRIPMHDIFKTEAFQGLEPSIVNNFGTPSIYNEFAWAFGEQQFREEDSIAEVAKNRFIDLHMVHSVRPAPIETVRARRSGLLAATRTLGECRVMIMTLGLVELWWDEQAGLYLNGSPLPSVLKGAPDRFALHVLTFEECHRFLKDALDIAFRHGRDDLRVILSVSPVPMMSTHRRTDVISANCYSKSVLRAVAEQLVEQDERITYFPSYETVTISDRRIAWEDDLVHVTRPMVAFNVERMLAAFAQSEFSGDPTLPKLAPTEAPEALMLAERARRARSIEDRDFFEQNAAQAKVSPAFALEYAKFLFDDGSAAPALEILEAAEGLEAALFKADVLLALERFDDAIAAIEEAGSLGETGMRSWRLLLDAHVGRRDAAGILEVEQSWGRAEPKETFPRQAHVGRALGQIGEAEAAIERLLPAANSELATRYVILSCARLLLGLKRPEEALAILDNVEVETETQVKQIKNLRRRCQKMNAKPTKPPKRGLRKR